MQMTIKGNGIEVTLGTEPPGDRRCGDCTLCCKLLPVQELKKPAGTVCQFQRSRKGCTVHGQRAQPATCAFWSCIWLMNDDAEDLVRPDRSRYVIDPMLDYVESVNNATGEVTRVDVVQIWCDPAHPNAHRDPALRAWIERRAARFGHAALIRFDSRRALHLFPPSMCADGLWHETQGQMINREHTPTEIWGGA